MGTAQVARAGATCDCKGGSKAAREGALHARFVIIPKILITSES